MPGFLVALLVAISYAGLDITNFAIVAGALSGRYRLRPAVDRQQFRLRASSCSPNGRSRSATGYRSRDRKASSGASPCARPRSKQPDRASLIVPNSELISSSVTNWTHRNALGRVLVKVGVSYKADPERVRNAPCRRRPRNARC